MNPTQYFRVKKKIAPKEMGIVVRVQEGKLATFAGGGLPSDFGCRLSWRGHLIAGRGYFSYPIEEGEAIRLKEDYTHWKALQAGQTV